MLIFDILILKKISFLGLRHILLFAVSKSNQSSFDITSSDANENISIKTIPEPAELTVQLNKAIENTTEDKATTENSAIATTNDDFIPQATILAKETLETIQLNVQQEQINDDKTPIEVKNDIIATVVEKEEISITEPEAQQQHVIQTELIPPECIEETATMDKISTGISNIGDSIMSDITSIATVGEEKLNNLAKETEKTVKEVPKNVIDYVKTSVPMLDNLLESDTTNAKDDVLQANIDEEKMKNLGDEKLSNDNTTNAMTNDENDKVKHHNKLNRGLAEDDSNEAIVDEALKETAMNSEVKFIDNGVDVSSTNIVQAMKEEMNEMSNDMKNKADELTMKYDGIVNAELESAKGDISSKMTQLKNGKIFNSDCNK